MTSNRSVLSYFKGAFICLIFGVLFAGLDGYLNTGMNGIWIGAFTALMLGGLEISMSMDNAVVNATVLRYMSPFWRKIFLTLGMLIAVFGMRVFFPLVIIAVNAGVSIIQAGKIALFDHSQFEHIMHESHMNIMGFGASFLLMVALGYFQQKEHETTWLPMENWFSKLPESLIARVVTFFVVTIPVLLVVYLVSPEHVKGFGTSMGIGLATYLIMEWFKGIVGGDIQKVAAKSGLMAFLWLEVIDASFSVDGVVGAFAITNDPILIAIGCGLIGAMTVRDATIYLVETNKLDTYEYLEPAAMWAIVSLVCIMFVSAFGINIPEVVAGGVSIAIIASGVICSIKKNGLHNAVSIDE